MQEEKNVQEEIKEEVKEETAQASSEEVAKEDANVEETENVETNKEEKKSSKLFKKKRIEELEEEVAKLKEELAASKNAYFKAYADAENLKKRLQAEADNVRKYRIQGFATEVLPVIDNLERALATNVEDPNLKNYVKGFEMIYQQLIHILNNEGYQQLIATLEKEGVKEIEAKDKPFDPNFHQALMQEAVEGVEPGMVVEVLQKGYMLKDRVLRATLVKVSE